ncbi:hypothetical protein [Variovorax boronicumulans]|uniref:hypothetical protein n=1 Tax=Variovorax boronicumulans TaxID=436515 RepID=UPI0033917341
MIRKTHLLAGVLAATGLSGCIVLPPPIFVGLPPGSSGGPPPSAMPFEHRSPSMAAWDLCDGQAEGAHPSLPGPRADALSGTCERGDSGALEFRAPKRR